MTPGFYRLILKTTQLIDNADTTWGLELVIRMYMMMVSDDDNDDYDNDDNGINIQ